MATSHGNKVLVGVLIDPYRFVLVEDYAKSNGKKLSALIREVFYQNLSGFLDPELVQEAEEYDSALWKESVRNRVAGRKSKKI